MLNLTRTQRVHLNESKRKLRVCLKAAVVSFGQLDPQAVATIKKQIECHGSLRPLMDRIANRMTSRSGYYDSQDYCLNDAGFWMVIHMEKDGRLKAYIHGDQRWSHPQVYRFLTAMFKFHGLLPEDRDPINLP